ncbi:acyl carrier protein [Aspergillus keveii]|uniref:Acyl carrier protein n=1 Tax=Aspergillus keveii TaxID=714993 RepID=A0ABR4FQW1_9EURO
MSTKPGMSIEDIVLRLVEDMLGVREVTLESTLIDDLGADELDLAELMMALEERLDIQIPDEVMEQLKTVGDIVDFVQSQTGE